MTDETASDWLAAALAETAPMSDALFRQGITEARQSCTFHGQIVPAVLRPQKSVDDYAKSLTALDWAGREDNCLSGPSEAKRLGDVVKRIGRD
jgi:hypothetical protein